MQKNIDEQIKNQIYFRVFKHAVVKGLKQVKSQVWFQVRNRISAQAGDQTRIHVYNGLKADAKEY